MMLLTAIDVTLRKTINFSILGAYELAQFMMAITIGLAMAQCGLEKGHIVVDVFISRLCVISWFTFIENEKPSPVLSAIDFSVDGLGMT